MPLGRTRTRHPSKRAALEPRGYRDRQAKYTVLSRVPPPPKFLVPKLRRVSNKQINLQLLDGVLTYYNTKKFYVSTTVFIITQGNTRATCFDS